MQMQSTPGGTVERSNVGSIQTYGIKDPAIVMQTLSSLYQNPRKIVVQEYISNGRDAHREAGKGNVPVQVVLPTELDPNLKIRDFGVGLDKERVTSVFCWFGESTKRGTNGQTGGFGIGAKCGFAYNSKSFTVTSVAVEPDGTKLKCLYAAYLNEEEIPEFVCMSEVEAGDDEPVGVEVSIPVREYDFNYIKSHVMEVTEFWDIAEDSVRPIITNGEVQYPERERVMEGQGWTLYDTTRDSYHGRRGEPFVILDGIRYPIPREVYEGLEDEVQCIARLNIALEFNTGEIYPAANRENLKFNDEVKELICARLTECYNLIKQDMEAEIVNCETLYDANLKWQELDEHIGSKIVGSVEWQGFKVNGNRMNAPGSSLVYYYHRKDYEEEGRLKTKKEGHLNWLSQDKVLVFNNEQGTCRPSPLRIKTIFKVTNAETIQVIHVTSTEDMDKWKEQGFEHLGCQDITTWDKMKQKRAKKGDRVVSKCYTHGNSSYDGRNRRTYWHKADIDVKNDEGVFVTFERGSNLEGYSDHDLAWIRKQFDIEIVGIPCRFIDKAKANEGMVPLKVWLKEKYKEETTKGMVQSDLSKERKFIAHTNLYNALQSGPDKFFTKAQFLKLMPRNCCFNRLQRMRTLVERYAKSRAADEKELENLEMLARLAGHENPNQDDGYQSKLVEIFEECKAKVKTLPLLQVIDFHKITDSYYRDEISEEGIEEVMEIVTEYLSNNL